MFHAQTCGNASCREGALSDTVAQVEFINVHELGSVKTRSPKKVAQHARFLAANMLVAVAAQVRVSEIAMLACCGYVVLWLCW